MAELNTYGDLKKVIKTISLQQKGEEIGNVAIDTILGAIPGIGAAKTTFDFVRAAFSKRDIEKTNTWLDKLDIDDEMSSIVDDTVENGFLKYLAKSIESKPDNTELEADFNMNAEMVDYLKRTYGGRTITGISEFKMNPFDKFLKRVSWKFPKGYPDMKNEQDKKLLFEMAYSILGEVEDEVEDKTKYGYKIGEFTTPSETLASRNWTFNSKVGYLGTGHYFYGDEETASEDRRFLGRSSNIKKFPLSDYKLYRASDPEKFYDNIKLITRELGLYASSGEELSEPELNEALEEIYNIIQDELGLSIPKDKVFTILKEFISDVQNRKDGPLLSNRLLQPLGYDGIDNTNTNLDNYGVGSVIFTD
jgi:hypothetical protein